MTIATRATISTAVTAGIAIGFSALALRFALHGDLDVYSSHFAMMRSMMGFGPDLTQLFVLVDRTFAMAMLLAVALALAGGVALGASLSRPVGALDRGLARFAAGRLDEPIQEQGPTEIERLARSANVMAARLAAARTAERELVAGIVHDLAHPITAIRGALEAVRDGFSDAADPATSRRLLDAVSALESTLNDLREVSAFDAGVLRIERTEVDLGALLRRTADIYRDFAQRRGIVLSATCDGAPTIRSDQRRLERLLDNLVVNAIQATPPNGSVSLGASARDASASIYVVDEAGPDSSRRLSAALTKGEGVGLGLRVVRSIAGALGARLVVRATDRGSAVEVALPG